MIILVDFENTHVSGLEGYEYLNDTDTLVMYYSDENSAVTRGIVDDLKEKNVNVRMVKLLKQHANALDMYIASTTGMFLDTGEKICIVSKDKGYAAVRDFWHSLRGAEILLGETIEECFLNSVANDEERLIRCKERNQKALLTDSFETMNTIPTRPTLSRSNRRRNANPSANLHRDEPKPILPNPLIQQENKSSELSEISRVIPKKVDTQAVKSAQDTSSEKNTIKAAPTANESVASAPNVNTRSRNNGNARPRTPQAPNFNMPSVNPYASMNEGILGKSSGEPDISVSSPSMQKAAKPEHKAKEALERETHPQDKKAVKAVKAVTKQLDTSLQASSANASASEITPSQKPESKPVFHAVVPHKEPATSIAKVEKEDPNRVHFIYDPVSRTMVRKGGSQNAEPVTAESHPKEASDTKAEREEPAVSETTFEETSSDNKVEDSSKAASVSQKEKSKTEADESPEKMIVSSKVKEPVSREAEKKEVAEDKTGTINASDAERAEDKSSDASAKTAPKEKAAPEKKQTARKSRSRKSNKSANKDTAGNSKSLEHSDTEKAHIPVTASVQEKLVVKDSISDHSDTTQEDFESSSKPTMPEKPQSRQTASHQTAVNYDAAEVLEKYGSNANTLHQYYLKMMKAFGREQGRIIYDETKKSFQNMVKERKAAKAAPVESEASVEKSERSDAEKMESADVPKSGQPSAEVLSSNPAASV
ncbi:MAG: PIN domain-containing protein [Oribacterium sp.]|nr:PIN domain-containing protein [Oribacterium sp.]